VGDFSPGDVSSFYAMATGTSSSDYRFLSSPHCNGESLRRSPRRSPPVASPLISDFPPSFYFHVMHGLPSAFADSLKGAANCTKLELPPAGVGLRRPLPKASMLTLCFSVASTPLTPPTSPSARVLNYRHAVVLALFSALLLRWSSYFSVCLSVSFSVIQFLSIDLSFSLIASFYVVDNNRSSSCVSCVAILAVSAAR